MTVALTERVLDAWQRGAGLDIHDQAELLLDLTGSQAAGEEGGYLYVRDRNLLELRRSLFGSSIEGVTRCPACGVDFEMPLDLALLQGAAPSPGPVTIEMDGFLAVVRPPRCSDLRGLEPDIASAGEELFDRCVIDASKGSETITAAQLPPAVRAAAATEISARGMESPLLDLVCGECEHAWRAPVDIVRLVLADLNSWATRLLGDVHRIATAYHWHERDIMALPTRRRLFYLEAIG
jgi:hypothetical protein